MKAKHQQHKREKLQKEKKKLGSFELELLVARRLRQLGQLESRGRRKVRSES